ncbi:hypothetical protein BGZ98_000714 [Dissophora globulifera]|nr:hypothetical protein BGZ98_000714 [Dissophora globulifera]
MYDGSSSNLYSNANRDTTTAEPKVGEGVLGGPTAATEGLLRVKSLAVNPAARQALLQQQKYQLQQQQQYMMGSDQSYSTNQSTNKDAWATSAATGSPSTLLDLPDTTLPTGFLGSSHPKGPGPSMGAVGSVSGPSTTTALATTSTQGEARFETTTATGIGAPMLSSETSILKTTTSSQEQLRPTTPSSGAGQQYQPGLNSPLTLPFNHTEASESGMAVPTRTTTTQSESPSFSPQQQQQQKKNSTLGSSHAALAAEVALARAGTVSTAGGVTGGGGNFITHAVPKSKPLDATTLKSKEKSHIEEGPGPVVLVAIGKTGQGKSSLLNRILGTNELRASASVRAVTKGIAERTGWARFEDNKRVLVTLADTPGLADTEGDDEKHIPILKEYIQSVGTRIGVTAFLLVFKIDSSLDIVMTILKAFNDIMADFPDVWDNVILVFTGCDYRREVHETKRMLHHELRNQIDEQILKPLATRPGLASESSFASAGTSASTATTATIGTNASSSVLSTEPSPSTVLFSTTGVGTESGTGGGGVGTPKHMSTPRANTLNDTAADGSGSGFPENSGVPMVFLTTAENICAIALGGPRCDCPEHAQYMKVGLKRLWNEAKKLKRWVLDCEEEDEFSGHG